VTTMPAMNGKMIAASPSRTKTITSPRYRPQWSCIDLVRAADTLELADACDGDTARCFVPDVILVLLRLTRIKCGFIDRWTRMPLSIGRSCTSAPSHHDLFSAACITTIAESELSTQTMVERRDLGQGARQLQERHGSRWLRERRPYASQMTPLAVIDAKPAHPRQFRQSQFPSG
jgi:hypothetical protein